MKQLYIYRKIDKYIILIPVFLYRLNNVFLMNTFINMSAGHISEDDVYFRIIVLEVTASFMKQYFTSICFDL